MTEGLKVILRDAELDDKDFIYSTWLRGNYYGSQYFSKVPQEIYFKEYGKYIGAILSLPETRVQIACSSEDSKWIVGLLVYKSREAYWIYVKRDFRGMGIAKLLTQGKDITIAKCLTKIAKIIMHKKGIIFNPF